MKPLFKFTAIMLTVALTGQSFTRKETPMNKPELIYVYDPLCGWCYGFSPVMKQIKNEYEGKLDFTIMSGGLAIGERALPLNVGYGYIKGALKTVENAAGVKFGKGFHDLLDEGTYLYNSEPPCIALTVFKELKEDKAFEFAHDLHHLIFYDGKDLNEESTYYELLDKYEVSREEFSKKYNDPVYRGKTFLEFTKAREMGASGFPTVILKKGDNYTTLARGYVDYQKLKKAIENNL